MKERRGMNGEDANRENIMHEKKMWIYERSNIEENAFKSNNKQKR